jgi:dsDNA-specific endonuclease/ATPase MutS2
MMKLSELWVGDKVVLVKSGRIGQVINIEKSGTIRVKISERVIKTSLSNIKQIEETKTNGYHEIDEWLSDLNKAKPEERKRKPFQSTLDLHFEKLDLGDRIVTQHNIFDIQIEVFKAWYNEAISRRKKSITVIHGKGTGTLKGYLLSYLKTDPHVALISSTNDDGALEILLK